MNNLARVLFSLNKFKEAEFLFLKKLNLLPNHAGIGITLNNLAVVYNSLNKL